MNAIAKNGQLQVDAHAKKSRQRISWLAAPIVAIAALSMQPHAVAAAEQAKKPVKVIFDTDMCTDIDDMMALAMLHNLHDRNEIDFLAVTITTEDPWAASYVDAVNTFYGHPNVAIGLVKDGLTIKGTLDKIRVMAPKLELQKVFYTQMVAEKKNPDGSLTYPHRLTDGSKAPEAVALLRKTLAAQPDGSVAMVQVGFSTNFARLLESKPDAVSSLSGVELVKKKAKLLSIMGGNYQEKIPGKKGGYSGPPEFNLALDIPSARKLFDLWPTAIVASGSEIGATMLYPAVSIMDDYAYVKNHPIVDSYKYLEWGDTLKWPHDHPTFDLTSVLYAARPDREYFTLSAPGKIVVDEKGKSVFEETAGGKHRFMTVTPEQKARGVEALVMLTSEPPKKK